MLPCRDDIPREIILYVRVKLIGNVYVIAISIFLYLSKPSINPRQSCRFRVPGGGVGSRRARDGDYPQIHKIHKIHKNSQKLMEGGETTHDYGITRVSKITTIFPMASLIC